MSMTALRTTKRTPFLQVVKSAVATIAAWLIAGWLFPGPPPVFAAIAALLVVQPSLNQSFAKAIERTVGVVAGVVIASSLVLLLGNSTWIVVIAIALALLIAWALKMTPTTANQVAISALLVLALGSATPNYAVNRVLETIVGALIGVIVNVLLVPPVAITPARLAVYGLGEELAASLDRLATAIARPQTPAQLHEVLLTARLMRPMRDAAETAIEHGRDSLTLNPRGRRRRDELAVIDELLTRFGPIVTQVIGMTRAFCDHYDPELDKEPSVRAIAEQLRRAAHDVRRDLTGAEPDATLEPEALTAAALTSPLVIMTPSSAHWILIGSLLEDLHRIHGALGPERERP